MGFMMIKPRCHYCGQKSNTKDHVTPTARGGTHDPRNLVPACAPCNELKNDMTYDEFIWFLRDILSDGDLKHKVRAKRILERLAPEMIPNGTNLG